MSHAEQASHPSYVDAAPGDERLYGEEPAENVGS